MRAWFYKQFGQSFEFVLVIEVGTRNGLVHAHVLAKWPKKFLTYTSVGKQWARAYPGAHEGGVHFSKHQKRKGSKTFKTSVFNAKTGAAYIAKYATKGCEVLELAPRKAAETLEAMIGRRLVRASQGFWTKPCCVCEDCGWKYGLAQGHRAQEFAIEIYQRKKLARDASKTKKQCKSIAAINDGGASLEWARGSASPGVLVEAARSHLAWVGDSSRAVEVKWTTPILVGLD